MLILRIAVSSAGTMSKLTPSFFAIVLVIRSCNALSFVIESSSLEILGATFSTGSSPSDKTYCTVYVGSEHAGEKVKISVLYSNGGYALNQGKVVSKTVSSDGYVKVASASAFDRYPDDAYITLYDNDGNVVDTQEVYLNENSGKQTF